jgi:predicted RNA-binding Zn-ribbon protein involved in translation (DUF1610 family)
MISGEAEMICPECGREMQPGFIRTNRPYLYWSEKVDFHMDGDRLEGDSWTKGAHLSAFRCPECKLLMAKYGSYDEKVKGLLSSSSLTYGSGSNQDKV